MRGFAFDYYGDVVSYTRKSEFIYQEIHKLITAEVEKAILEGKKIVLITHSLGTIIISNYLWDAFELEENYLGEKVKDYLKWNLEFLFTMGSPLALFALEYNDMGSPPNLPLKTRWINILGKNDTISYPIGSLNKQYKALGIEDVYLNVGTDIIRRSTPLGHIDYFDDNNVCRILKGYLNI